MRRIVLPLAAVTLTGLVAHAAPINPGLPGNTQFDTWETAHLTTAANPGYGAFPGAAPWPAPIGSGLGADATLMKTANGATTGGPYPASGSLYFGSFAGGGAFAGTLAVSDATPVANLKNVVFQVDVSGASGFDFYQDVLPVLNYNGGAQAITPTVAGIANQVSNGTVSTPGGEVEIFRNTWLLQYDLSAVAGPVNSFSVSFSSVPHAQIYGLRLDQSDTFAAVAVPEPASLGLVALAAASILIRRKRR